MIAAAALSCLLAAAPPSEPSAAAPQGPSEATALPAAPPGIAPSDIEALRRLAQSGAPASLPPVTARMFTVAGRLDLSPAFAVSVGDPFFRSLMLGVRLEQHFGERWSAGGHLFAGASLVSAPVQLCGATACSAPLAAQLDSTPGDLQMAFGAQIAWRPVYGKLSLLGEKTVHFDFYFALGPELLRERIAPDAASSKAARWAVGGRATLGERLYVSDRVSLRLSASEIVYGSRVRGRIEPERKLMIEAGIGFLFGSR